MPNVDRIIEPNEEASAELLVSFAEQRLADWRQLCRGILALDTMAPFRQQVLRSLDIAGEEAPIGLIRRMTSPVFLHWLSLWSRVTRWDPTDPIIASAMHEWDNVTIAPDLWPLVPDLRLGYRDAIAVLADLRYQIARSGEEEEEEAQVSSACLLPGSRVALRGDVPQLRIGLRADAVPERHGTVSWDVLERDDAYDTTGFDVAQEAASLVQSTWPAEYADLESFTHVIVPRRAPLGWRQRPFSFTVSSLQGACWINLDDTPLSVACAMIHEKGHIKLRYLEQRFSLVNRNATNERFRVGWRTDARPLIGILEGVFVHLQIAMFLRKALDQGHGCGHPKLAEELMAGTTRDVKDGLDVLQCHGRQGLTGVGAAVANAVAERLQLVA